MVDYDKLLVRCRICLSWKHKASECKDSMRRPQYRHERDRSTFPHSFQQTEKGKTIATDEDGFQQVQHRKNTRRNIFDKNTLAWFQVIVRMILTHRALTEPPELRLPPQHMETREDQRQQIEMPSKLDPKAIWKVT